MNDDRYKQLMEQVGMPNSQSLLTALKQVANEAAQESEAKNKHLLKAEHATSDAYIRLRTKLNAFDTPHAPTPDQIWEHTEAKLDALRLERDQLAAHVEILRWHLQRVISPDEPWRKDEIQWVLDEPAPTSLLNHNATQLNRAVDKFHSRFYDVPGGCVRLGEVTDFLLELADQLRKQAGGT